MTQKTKVALVTGANKGLGFATSEELAKRGYHVVMLGRKLAPLKAAAKKLMAQGLSVETQVGDIKNPATAKKALALLKKKFKKLDVLVNNAGVFIDNKDNKSPNILNVKPKTVLNTFEINTLGAFQMIQALLPLLQKSPMACVVNVSSGMGQLNDMNGGYPAYRLSKAALNALTKSVAEEFGSDTLKINSVCPGWVRTEMGGANANRSVEEGIAGIIWAATLESNGPSGGFFRDGQPLSW